MLFDPRQGMASIDGVHKNVLLPKRSTGELVAAGLVQTSMPQPSILEGYNVERGTKVVLIAGGDGRGTLIGNFLEDAAKALGGTILRWETIRNGGAFHLRVHVSYP